MEETASPEVNGADNAPEEIRLQLSGVSSPSREPRRKVCTGCSQPLADFWIQFSMGGEWHPACFLCTGCQKPITERNFQVHGRDPYHKQCYQKKFDPVCDVCHDYVPINERSGMIEWRFHPFWGTKYCPAHEADKTARCSSCERMQSRGQVFRDLDDVRKLCPQCVNSATIDRKDCQGVQSSVRKLYARLGLSIDQDIPVSLVDSNALKAAAENDGHHRFQPDARGMCTSKERIIDPANNYIARGLKGSPISRPGTSQGHLRLVRHDVPQPLTRKCVVTGILVLFGFPRLLTGSIIAHEMMHAWLKQNGPMPYLDSAQGNLVEEGICQYMAYLWLQTQLAYLDSIPSLKNQFERRLGECFMQQIEKHDSPIYGDGFRAARLAVDNYGLLITLQRIKTTVVENRYNHSPRSKPGAIRLYNVGPRPRHRDACCTYVANGETGKRGKKNEDDGREIASNPAAIRSELKRVLEQERDKVRKRSEALDAAEKDNDALVEAVSAILLNEENMDAMVSYGKRPDPKNTKGKSLYEKYKELTDSMDPALKGQLKKIMLDRIKHQYKKDAKAAEKFMAKTLGKLFPDLLPTFFKTHDYDKGKGPEQ